MDMVDPRWRGSAERLLSTLSPVAVRWDKLCEKLSKKVEHRGVPLCLPIDFTEKYSRPLGTIFDFDIKELDRASYSSLIRSWV